MTLDTDGDVVLVTGAAGHIGRELCRILRNGHQEIVAADLQEDLSGGIVLTVETIVSQKELSPATVSFALGQASVAEHTPHDKGGI